MKTLLSLLAILYAIQFSYAQTNTFPASGNVGIGTTSPSSLLHLFSGNNIDVKMLSTAVGGYSRLLFGAGTNGARWNLGQRDDSNGIFSIEGDSNGFGAWGSRFAITLSGNVGIGTTSPTQKLDVAGTILAEHEGLLGNLGIASDVDARIYMQNTTSGTGQNWNIISDTDGSFSMGIYGNAPFQTIQANGNVGIGTTTIPTGYKMAVNGNVIAAGVQVLPHGDWPDYVFKPHYILPSLSEVKSYIDQNQHLPDMPSAETVEKEGQNIGEMNKLLLEKVEELTLYAIEKDKQINDQESKLVNQQSEIDQLKESLEALTREVHKN